MDTVWVLANNAPRLVAWVIPAELLPGLLEAASDDRLLAYTHDDGAIAIWRVAAEGLEWVTALGPEPGAPATMLVFTPDTQLLITGTPAR
jgi:hypothetical protein